MLQVLLMGREEWEEQESSGEDQHSEAASVESGSFSGSVVLPTEDSNRDGSSNRDRDEDEDQADAPVSTF